MSSPALPPQPDALQAPSPPALDKRDWIAGLEKGLSIIECFDDANPRLTASQAGARCGMTRTAARRYLLTLEHLGYVAGRHVHRHEHGIDAQGFEDQVEHIRCPHLLHRVAGNQVDVGIALDGWKHVEIGLVLC